eukprot:g9650.t1
MATMAAVRRFASCAGKATRFARAQPALPAARLPLRHLHEKSIYLLDPLCEDSVRSYITVTKYSRDDVLSLLDEYHATALVSEEGAAGTYRLAVSV